MVYDFDMNSSIIIAGVVFILMFMKGDGFLGDWLFALFPSLILAVITYFGLELWKSRDLKVYEPHEAPDEIIIAEWESNDLNRFKTMPPHVAAAYARQKSENKK